MKINYTHGIKSNGNSYLLQDAMNSTEMIRLTANDDSLNHIKLFTMMTVNNLWALLSDGNLYEYDIQTKRTIIIENSGQICSYAIQ